MIRSVTRRRLGQLEITPGCVEYQDPNTGEWISDLNAPGCGQGPLPADPGSDAAVSQFAGESAASANAAALNQIGVPFFGATTGGTQLIPSASSLTAASGLPSPIPGLGLGPNTQTWLIYAIAGAALLLFLSGNQSTGGTRSRRSSR